MYDNPQHYAYLPFRQGVGIMLLNNEKKIFVGMRIDTTTEAWQMPQGGIDDNELVENALFRELKEETGISKAKIVAQSKEPYSYDLPYYLVDKLWNGKYRGQEQRWFFMRFTGEDSDINIETEEPEFARWKWIAVDELLDVIVPFKRIMYSQIIEEFSELIEKEFATK
jgi:putative (di)nucleoside polyphosphate hydrolase